MRKLAPRAVAVARKRDGFNSACSSSSVRIVKEIRLTAPGEKFLEQNGLKILHLVRDPRAVVNSRLRIEGFCLRKGAPGCAKPICSEMTATLSAVRAVKGTPTYQLVRFEAVCESPLEESQSIFTWLGYPLLPATVEWIKSSTHATDAPQGAGKYVRFL